MSRAAKVVAALEVEKMTENMSFKLPRGLEAA